MINAGICSMFELKSCYSLDEALKLYSIWKMKCDIEAVQAEEMSKESV